VPAKFSTSLRNQLFILTVWLHYKCINAARPLSPGANVDTLNFHNQPWQSCVHLSSTTEGTEEERRRHHIRVPMRFCVYSKLSLYSTQRILSWQSGAIDDFLQRSVGGVRPAGDVPVPGHCLWRLQHKHRRAQRSACSTSDAVAAVLQFHSTRCSANTQGRPLLTSSSPA